LYFKASRRPRPRKQEENESDCAANCAVIFFLGLDRSVDFPGVWSLYDNSLVTLLLNLMWASSNADPRATSPKTFEKAQKPVMYTPALSKLVVNGDMIGAIFAKCQTLLNASESKGAFRKNATVFEMAVSPEGRRSCIDWVREKYQVETIDEMLVLEIWSDLTNFDESAIIDLFDMFDVSKRGWLDVHQYYIALMIYLAHHGNESASFL